MKENDLKILISDIENLRRYHLFSFWNPVTDLWYEFRLNKFTNDLSRFVKFCEEVKKNYDYVVYFNGLKYDMQVIQFVIDNHQKWINKPWDQICEIIFQFSQHVIKLTNSEQFPPYKESEFDFRIIDVFEIPHFSNKNKRTSLKWLEFMMDMDDIEEMPVHHTTVHFTKEMMDQTDYYCRHDIKSTYLWYKHLTGKVEHPFYKYNNKIQDRLDIIEEGLLPIEAINYPDAKLGDELNKKAYCRLTGKTMRDVYELKRNRKPTKRFTYGEAIPDYVKFETLEMQAFYNKIKDVKVSLQEKDDQEFPLKFRGNTFMIARGGIHSTEKYRIIIPTKDEILQDADVGAQYTVSIKKRLLFPSHLGLPWNDMMIENILKKDDYKQQGKLVKEESDKKKLKGLETTYKLALNGGGYGKTGETTNWQYDPRVMYFCTIGNQFEILMLIEMLELKGIHCVSANTDGIVCLFDRSKEEEYYEICHKWEEIVGNTIMGKLEYTEFSALYQESVNCYVAVKSKDGEVKIKGRFDVDGELNKNNTKDISRIERRAIANYFHKKIPVEDTIKNSTNIFDFCIGLKSSDDYFFKTVDPVSGKETNHKKVVRFFASDKGVKLLKIKSETCETNGPEISRVSKDSLVTIFNTKFNVDKFDMYNINYNFYIDRAKEVINPIEKPRKNKNFKAQPKEQGNLF